MRPLPAPLDEPSRAVVDALADAVLVIEADTGRILDVNVAASLLLGTPREALIASSLI